jgi:hypothetical protein
MTRTFETPSAVSACGGFRKSNNGGCRCTAEVQCVAPEAVDVLGLVRAELRHAFVSHLEAIHFHLASGVGDGDNIVECEFS